MLTETPQEFEGREGGPGAAPTQHQADESGKRNWKQEALADRGRLRVSEPADGKRRASPKRAERRASPTMQGGETHGKDRHNKHDTNIYIPPLKEGHRQKSEHQHNEEHDVWPQIEDILNNPNVDDYEFLAAEGMHEAYQTTTYMPNTVEKMELQLRAAQQLQKVAEKEKADAEERMEELQRELNLIRANLAGREVLHKDSYLLNIELEEEKKKNSRLRDAIEILKARTALADSVSINFLLSADRQRNRHRHVEERA
eukprot:767230-Hanusia_phi.AAC.4